MTSAEAVAEAVQRPTMKFVATRAADQLDLQAPHRGRDRLVGQRAGIIKSDSYLAAGALCPCKWRKSGHAGRPGQTATSNWRFAFTVL